MGCFFCMPLAKLGCSAQPGCGLQHGCGVLGAVVCPIAQLPSISGDLGVNSISGCGRVRPTAPRLPCTAASPAPILHLLLLGLLKLSVWCLLNALWRTTRAAPGLCLLPEP